jgi:hypothetical protein
MEPGVEPMEYVLGVAIVLFTVYGLVRIAMLYLFPKDT